MCVYINLVTLIIIQLCVCLCIDGKALSTSDFGVIKEDAYPCDDRRPSATMGGPLSTVVEVESGKECGHTSDVPTSTLEGQMNVKQHSNSDVEPEVIDVRM